MILCRLARAAVLLMFSARFAVAAATPGWQNGPGFRSAEVRPQGTGKVGFTLVDPKSTGISFTNVLAGDAYLTNAVAHNGSGVALGDVDGDGWVDIYFCNLQGPNRLYRNLGEWHFEEMEIGPAACVGQYSTGAVFADVDGDGDLDLLVNGIGAGTRLFLNDGKGHWTESIDSGLSRTASPTSMALADIDGDGDLDLYCTHYIDEMHLADLTVRFGLKKQGNDFVISSVNGQPTTLPRLTNRFQMFGNGRVRELPEVDGFYRNDGKGHFTPIEFEPGVFMDSNGKPIAPYRDWGLAVMFRDLNGDGAPDIYVCNDNASPDRMWLNTGQGTFRAFDPLAFRHTSRSSMGIDIADVNRDGLDDIFVVDMLARDHVKRITQLVKDFSDPQLRENVDEQPRYNRNALFFGRPDGTYAEAALNAGVAASDWSWCPMFVDVDLDGYEDLVITTGFSFDVMDQDSHDRIRKGRLSPDQLKRSRQFHPRWPTPKAAFRNRRDGTFEPMAEQWGLSQAGVSNGAALADLDNDGDLDLVINNLNEVASVYRNDGSAPRIAVRLRGNKPNTQGIGAKISLISGLLKQSQEMISGGRYLSGDAPMRAFAATDLPPDARLEVQWRNGERSVVTNLAANRIYEIDQQGGRREVVSPKNAGTNLWFTDASEMLKHTHIESTYDDWARQPLLPHRLSRFGPAVSWIDLDGDGWEDLVITAARGQKLAAFYNQAGKSFRQVIAPEVAPDDQTAVVGWHDKNGPELATSVANFERPASAPSEIGFYNASTLIKTNAMSLPMGSCGPMALADIDGDGDLDLFVGGRFFPARYPEPVGSMMWINENGSFRKDAFPTTGMVCGATFTDFDSDGAPDLALAEEWGGVRLFRNKNGKFTEVTEQMGLAGWTGLWTCIATGDFDGDGRLDLVVGNWGRNSAYEIYQPTILRLYYWNADGVVGLLESWKSGENFLPVRDRTKLSAVLPDLAIRFPTHAAFAQATVPQILGERMASARYLEAAHLESIVLLNRGSKFEPVPLPREAQLSPVMAVNVGDFDGDGIEDIFLSQNFYGVLTDLTRDDAGRGLWLRGLGNGQFSPIDGSVSGIKIPGEQRGAALADFNHDGRVDLVITQNNGPTKLYINQRAKKGLRVLLQGPPHNPTAIGAQLRFSYSDGRLGPVRMIGSGAGFSEVAVMGFAEPSVSLRVRWPAGGEEMFPVDNQSPDIKLRYGRNISP